MRDNFSINQMKGCSLMKHDYPDYLRDMNHDGDIDSHDFALYHEMMDEDERGSPAYDCAGIDRCETSRSSRGASSYTDLSGWFSKCDR